ncbi:glycoside hydrolase family 3 protein [bacterium]|nr:glycoside hydrolase family 3 protein [bacterium]
MMENQEMNVGQFFVLGFEGTTPDYEFLKFVENYQPGGFILFKRNIIDLMQLRRLISLLNSTTEKPFIMIDQEGGEKNRITEGIPTFPSNRDLAKKKDLSVVDDAYYITAKYLHSLGINTNLVPVCDVARNRNMMHRRAFGSDVTRVEKCVPVAIEATHRGGCYACAKHFPGLGDLAPEDDPHESLPIINSPKSDFESIHYKPFQAAIAAGVEFVMTSHFQVPHLDDEVVTFSSKILNTLRKNLKFDGIILTDDLTMNAVYYNIGIYDTIFKTFISGHDLILIAKDFAYEQEAVKSLEKAFMKKEIQPERFIESQNRLNNLREV